MGGDIHALVEDSDDYDGLIFKSNAAVSVSVYFILGFLFFCF